MNLSEVKRELKRSPQLLAKRAGWNDNFSFIGIQEGKMLSVSQVYNEGMKTFLKKWNSGAILIEDWYFFIHHGVLIPYNPTIEDLEAQDWELV